MADRINDDNTNAVNSGGDIRIDDLAAGAAALKDEAPTEPKSKAKAKSQDAKYIDDLKIKIDGKELTGEQILAAAAALQHQVVTESKGAKLDLNAAAQVMNIRNLKTKDGSLDFEKMTEDSAYDLDLPIVAKPFSNEDSLDVNLKDKAYVARWVNVNPLRLGSMRAKGFLYITPDDLASPLNIEVEVDAQGHYRLNDVVAMRILKERYYGALRNAHLRAITAVSAAGAHKAATGVATQYMEKEAGGEFVDYANQGKIKFYQTSGA